MSTPPTLEAWQRGPIDGVPPLLMPAAHALIHAREDAERALRGLSTDQIWQRPGGGAVRRVPRPSPRRRTGSPPHVRARASQLTGEQRRRMAAEGDPGTPPAGAPELLAELGAAIEGALDQIRATPESTLLDPRGIGRQQIPTTVIGPDLSRRRARGPPRGPGADDRPHRARRRRIDHGGPLAPRAWPRTPGRCPLHRITAAQLRLTRGLARGSGPGASPTSPHGHAAQ